MEGKGMLGPLVPESRYSRTVWPAVFSRFFSLSTLLDAREALKRLR